MSSEIFRDSWTSKAQFLLACVGYAVGLGNVWRFPYLCFKSGGGAFLIPYFLTLFVCGIPLLYLEMAIGQFTRYGPVQAFQIICPLLKGVGIATVVISFILCTYYNVIITWALYYFFNSFRSVMPWYECNATWSSDNCALAANSGNSSRNMISSTQDFFDRVVLSKTDGIDNMGNMQWNIFGYYVLAWLLVYFCIFKGIKSAGKVVYATATFPYLVLISLLIASTTLPGSDKGVLYFIKPIWKDLLKPEVWVNAAAQNFNSIGISFGSLIAFSSYNPRNNNIFRDTLFISFTNSATSILAGLVIFSAMGHMSESLGVPIQNVTTQGPELVFIVYPQIFGKLPIPQIWAVLFFFMLICLGIDSQFAMVEVVNTTIMDSIYIQKYFKILRRKEIVALIVCGTAFLLGIANLMQGGIYVFTLLDSYTAIVSLMFLAFFEVIAVCWLYGGWRVAEDVQQMTGKPPAMFFKVCWVAVSPILIGVLLIFTISQYKPAKYGSYKYPVWADVIGWLITLASILCVPIGAILTLINEKGSFTQRLRNSIIPRLKKNKLDEKEKENQEILLEDIKNGDNMKFGESFA